MKTTLINRLVKVLQSCLKTDFLCVMEVVGWEDRSDRSVMLHALCAPGRLLTTESAEELAENLRQNLGGKFADRKVVVLPELMRAALHGETFLYRREGIASLPAGKGAGSSLPTNGTCVVVEEASMLELLRDREHMARQRTELQERLTKMEQQELRPARIELEQLRSSVGRATPSVSLEQVQSFCQRLRSLSPHDTFELWETGVGWVVAHRGSKMIGPIRAAHSAYAHPCQAIFASASSRAIYLKSEEDRQSLLRDLVATGQIPEAMASKATQALVTIAEFSAVEGARDDEGLGNLIADLNDAYRNWNMADVVCRATQWLKANDNVRSKRLFEVLTPAVAAGRLDHDTLITLMINTRPAYISVDFAKAALAWNEGIAVHNGAQLTSSVHLNNMVKVVLDAASNNKANLIQIEDMVRLEDDVNSIDVLRCAHYINQLYREGRPEAAILHGIVRLPLPQIVRMLDIMAPAVGRYSFSLETLGSLCAMVPLSKLSEAFVRAAIKALEAMARSEPRDVLLIRLRGTLAQDNSVTCIAEATS